MQRTEVCAKNPQTRADESGNSDAGRGAVSADGDKARCVGRVCKRDVVLGTLGILQSTQTLLAPEYN
jgi:hypothetical protein